MCFLRDIFCKKKDKNAGNVQSQPSRPVQPHPQPQVAQRAPVAPWPDRPQQPQVTQYVPPPRASGRAGVSVQTTPVTSQDMLHQAHRPPSCSPPRQGRNPSPATQAARNKNGIVTTYDQYAKCQVLVGPYSKHYPHTCPHCWYPRKYGPCAWRRTALIDPRSRNVRR